MGILDIVKQEAVELEKATRKRVHEETYQPQEGPTESVDIFSDEQIS